MNRRNPIIATVLAALEFAGLAEALSIANTSTLDFAKADEDLGWPTSAPNCDSTPGRMTINGSSQPTGCNTGFANHDQHPFRKQPGLWLAIGGSHHRKYHRAQNRSLAPNVGLRTQSEFNAWDVMHIYDAQTTNRLSDCLD